MALPISTCVIESRPQTPVTVYTSLQGRSQLGGTTAKLNALALDDSPMQISVQQILRNHVLYDSVLSALTPASMMCLRRVCRIAKSAVNSYMVRAFNINRHLSLFFSNPTAFRSLQARTSTLISGSSALQFFDRSYYPDSDLDVYVYMHHRLEVGSWLLDNGYKFIPNSSQNASFYIAASDPRILRNNGTYSMRGVSAVFTFVKPALYDPNAELKVQVIVAVHTPIEVILNFHSTCVMNIISYQKAYALYPHATFEENISLICSTPGPKQEPAIEKYMTRGWRMVRTFTPSTQYHYCRSFRVGHRWVEDSHSWIIPLNMDDVHAVPASSSTSTPLSQDPIVASSWQLICTDDMDAEMDFSILGGDSYAPLCYYYAVGDEEILQILRFVLEKRANSERMDPAFQLKPKRQFDESLIMLACAHLREQQLVGFRP